VAGLEGGFVHWYISITMIAYIYEPGGTTLLGHVKRIWLTLVLAVVLSALEVERRERFVEPAPIVLRVSGYAPPVLRARPFRPHYRTALARRNPIEPAP
jgi:hypothetical protein